MSDLSGNGYGFHLYPERRAPGKVISWNTLTRNPSFDKIRCEKSVQSCARSAPLVKLMISALKAAGCPVDLKRHIMCEPCISPAYGGYDIEMNQVVVCQNTTSPRMIHGVLAHELLHMFDNCRAKLDLSNKEHIACTEIRAANFLHCSFMRTWIQGNASPFNFAEAHKKCVRELTIQTMSEGSSESRDEVAKVVDKVLDVCYNDLEPFGRRIRGGSKDKERCYRDRYNYGVL